MEGGGVLGMSVGPAGCDGRAAATVLESLGGDAFPAPSRGGGGGSFMPGVLGPRR
jgi:hypothetical protein